MTIEKANELFKMGKFVEAEKLYLNVLSKEQKNVEVLINLGRIALFSNRFEEAEKNLLKAIEYKPENKVSKNLLIEVYYRQDRYQKAAELLQQINQNDLASLYESFGDIQPNEIRGNSYTKIKFVKTDPLPIIQVKVNGNHEVNFLIDTGASDTVIDDVFATELNIEKKASREGVFAGGKKATVYKGRIDSLEIGNFTIKNSIIAILPVRQFAQRISEGLQIDGIIGTNLFYHFIPTIDYSNGQLILHKINKDNLQKTNQEIDEKQSITIPFWMAGDHFIVAWGKVNKSEPMLFFIDTGLAGGGFTCPESTLQIANIILDEKNQGVGVGGGGEVQVIPFMVEKLTLGDAIEKNIRGLYTSGFHLEKSLGFHIRGIISHGFFRNYCVTFDFIKMRLILKRFKKS